MPPGFANDWRTARDWAIGHQSSSELDRVDPDPGLFPHTVFAVHEFMTDAAATERGGVSVEVRGLRKSFAGQPVLKGVDFKVDPAEIYVIMGPSGSGKSVLLKHVIGLEEPDEGEILIDGHSVEEEDIMDRYRLAMVFQSGALLNSLTVGENVGLYLAEHRLKSPEEIQQIVSDKLEIVGLKGIEAKYPNEL